MLIPGFEAGVIGMEIDETKKVNIPAAEAYGEHSEEFIEEISREILPAEITPEVGMQLMQETPEGQQIPLLITAVSDTTVTLDANHPLAGKALTFEIKVVGIN
jgi:FKBP-type peptidyl-prolyl cis-trans isomerase SlpA